MTDDKIIQFDVTAAKKAVSGFGNSFRRKPQDRPRPKPLITAEVESEGLPGVRALPRPAPKPKASKKQVKPATEPTKAAEPAKTPAKGAITRVDVASARERVFVVNGITFFAVVNPSGYRTITACHEDKKVLKSASLALEQQGYSCDVKRDERQQNLWLLQGKERRPSGVFLDEATQGKTLPDGKIVVPNA